jgi:CelD/BcsL family acetyltransferase involved in cellulose biosynthesis
VIQIKRISEFEFFGMEEAWNSLLRESSANNFFLSWEWLSQWWKHFRKGKELFILGFYDGNELSGIAPLFKERRLYFKHFPVWRVGFLGTEMVHSDYLDFIVKPGLEPEALTSLFEYFHGLQDNWDVLELSDIKDGSPTLDYFAGLEGDIPYRISTRMGELCPYLALPSTLSAYRSALSRNTRYNISRRSKNLAKSFGGRKVSLEEKGDGHGRQTMENLIHCLFHLHRKRWAGRNQKTLFSTSQVEQFHTALLPELMEKKKILIHSLSIDSQPVALLYGFIYGEKYYFYQSGFDPTFSSYSPGLVLMNFSIEQAIQKGLAEYDFLRGEEIYKGKFTDSFRRTHHVEIWRNEVKRKYLRAVREIYHTLKRYVRTEHKRNFGEVEKDIPRNQI